MKLGAKIIVSIMIFFSIIFLFGGYVLISYFYEVTMEREIEGAIEQYQYNKFVVQANLITKGENWFAGAVDGQYDISSMASDMNGMVAFLATDGSVLFSAFPAKTEFSGLFADAERDMVNYRFMKVNNRTVLLTMGMVSHGDVAIYLITGVDVEKIQEQQAQIIRKFGVIYTTAVGIGIFLVLCISFFITRPIKQLTVATKKIAEGDYEERVAEGGSDEVSQLAVTRHFIVDGNRILFSTTQTPFRHFLPADCRLLSTKLHGQIKIFLPKLCIQSYCLRHKDTFPVRSGDREQELSENDSGQKKGFPEELYRFFTQQAGKRPHTSDARGLFRLFLRIVSCF